MMNLVDWEITTWEMTTKRLLEMVNTTRAVRNKDNVKRGVIIHPALDEGIRRLQSALITVCQEGSYSTALNLIGLIGLWTIENRKDDKELLDVVSKLLEEMLK